MRSAEPGTTAYREVYQRSLADPAGFWAAVAERLDWKSPWETVLSCDDEGIERWFAGGRINACFNCVDRHVRSGYGGQPALICESPVTGASRTLDYAGLQDLTARLGGAMRQRGAGAGDRVLIYMPNSIEAVAAMLACARIGAVHSVVFGGFAAHELAARIADSRPALVIAASCGIEGARTIPYQPILQAAYAICKHRPDATIVWQRPQAQADLARDGWLDWDAECAAAAPVECVAVDAIHPLYILYTSGTTGQPKGIVRDTGGHLAALAWTMSAIYDCPPGEVFWAASDVGWVVGHSYIAYGPLLNRNTSIIFEGKPVGTPDAGAFWRVMEQRRVRSFFTAPTALRAIRQADPDGDFARRASLPALRAVFLAGERTDPSTLAWIEDLLGVPVVDHWWQTETGSAICANPIGIEALPVKPGSASLPMPGWNLACLDEAGNALPPGQSGAIVAKRPLPPGFAPTIWQAPDRYRAAYFERFPGYYLTGDAGYADEDGYLFVMARIDDVINVAGHRLSSSALEEAIAAHPDVAECAVIGRADALKGQIPVAFVVARADCADDRDEARVAAEIVALVRERIGPVAALREVHLLKRLPKTRSGKILRKTIRQIADGDDPPVPPTIEDAGALKGVRAALAA